MFETVLSYPDPRILAFFVFLAFFVLRFSLLFCAFLLSFPRISRVLQRGKSSLFSGDPRFFCQKSKDWRVRVFSPFPIVLWGITQLSRDMLQHAVSHGCACTKLSAKGISHHVGIALTSLKGITRCGVGLHSSAAVFCPEHSFQQQHHCDNNTRTQGNRSVLLWP